MPPSTFLQVALNGDQRHPAAPRTPGRMASAAAAAIGAGVPNPHERLRLVAAWNDLPDLVTANQGEIGIVDLCEVLLSRGVEIEAGLLTTDDAVAFVNSGLAARCRRILIEPLESDIEVALQNAAAIEAIVAGAGIGLEQVHHGYGIASWAVNRRALQRGHGIRTGLEDVTVLPDNSPAEDNAASVAAAVELIRAHNEAHPPRFKQTPVGAD